MSTVYCVYCLYGIYLRLRVARPARLATALVSNESLGRDVKRLVDGRGGVAETLGGRGVSAVDGQASVHPDPLVHILHTTEVTPLYSPLPSCSCPLQLADLSHRQCPNCPRLSFPSVGLLPRSCCVRGETCHTQLSHMSSYNCEILRLYSHTHHPLPGGARAPVRYQRRSRDPTAPTGRMLILATPRNN